MMGPACPATVSNPKYLTDPEIRGVDLAEPIPDDALLSAHRREPPSQYAARRTGQGEAKLPTELAVSTEGLAPWIRRAVPRLLRLTNLEHNWDSYGGIPPSIELVLAVIQLLNHAEIVTFPQPEFVPVSDGGIQLEWYMGDRELEIEFRKDGSVEFLTTDNQKNREREGSLRDLDGLRSLLMWVDGKM